MQPVCMQVVRGGVSHLSLFLSLYDLWRLYAEEESCHFDVAISVSAHLRVLSAPFERLDVRGRGLRGLGCGIIAQTPSNHHRLAMN